MDREGVGWYVERVRRGGGVKNLNYQSSGFYTAFILAVKLFLPNFMSLKIVFFLR